MENIQINNEMQTFIKRNSLLLLKEYRKSINQNNNSIEENEKKLLSKIDILYQTLLEFYGQRQYRKVAKSVKYKSDRLGKFFLSEWKLLHLRMLSFQKILDAKMAKYCKSNIIPHFSNYINDINSDIDNWIILTKELIDRGDNEYKKSFFEFIISFILKNCLILSKKYIQTGYIKAAIMALASGVRLINNTFIYFCSPDSYYLSAEIFLSFSSFMIVEKNFKTALNLISLSIKFSYISLELKLSKNLNNYQTLFDLNEYENEKKILYKIIFNLSTAFYQLSTCYEQLHDPYNAYFSIKTSIFFSKFYNSQKISLYQDLIKKIEKRLLMRNRIIIFFGRYIGKDDLEEKVVKKKKFHRSIISYEEKKQKKYEKLRKYIEKIKLADVDDDDPDLFNRVGDKEMKPKVIRVTKHLQLLNYLMNDGFKDIINNMKKIEINKIDKETIYKISKRIINFKNKEHFKIKKNIEKQLEYDKKRKEINRRNSTIIVGNYKEENDEKNRNKSEKKNHINKSNTLKSTTALSLTTTFSKKKPRINSAFQRGNNNRIKNMKRKNISNFLTFRKTYPKNTFSSNSLYSIPTKQLSFLENNFSNKKSRSKHFINFHNKGLPTSNSINLKLSSETINYQSTKKNKKKNIFKYNKSYVTPKYDHDKIFFSKGFMKKYSFLKKQYDKEIDFHKNLLKTKIIKEDLVKPKSPNIKDINEQANNFFYITYYNELINAKEKQIIFDKKEINKKYKLKSSIRFQSPQPKQFDGLNSSIDFYSDNEQVNKMNDKYLNNMSNIIMEINKKESILSKYNI